MVKSNLLFDTFRQAANFLGAPLIWICSSLGLFLEDARSPSDFSDLTENLMVPQTFAFSIWLPIFLGIFAYSVIQALGVNKSRAIFRDTGWWVASGLWGIVAWGLITAFVSDRFVEVIATLVFIPTMIALVVAMVRFSRRRQELKPAEMWLVLAPVSLIAGWCSIAVFIGFNGLAWSWVESWSWSPVGTTLSVLGLSLWWIVYVIRQGAINKIYAVPIIWGLGFLSLRHFSDGGSLWIGSTAVIGIVAVALACTVKTQNALKRQNEPRALA